LFPQKNKDGTQSQRLCDNFPFRKNYRSRQALRTGIAPGAGFSAQNY
jgi:hypothetical protein